MILCPRTSTLRRSQRALNTLRRLRRTKLNLSSSSEAKAPHCLDEDCHDFLPWLEQKAGAEISKVLSIGRSAHGRLLFASRIIQNGDCILKVPYNVQIAPDTILPEIKSLLRNEVGDVAKLAIVILFERKMGWGSEWAPYVSRLPRCEEMHNTIFWSENELEMIRQSSVYEETIRQKAQIQKEFLAIRPILNHFPEIFKDVTCMDFMHACALVGSRAWGSTRGVSMIPFADFLNHDGVSEAMVLSDDDKQYTEVIADRDYAAGEQICITWTLNLKTAAITWQVLIRYGKYSNATLMLDFGFILPYNIHDQVQLKVNIPEYDLLREKKLEILQRDYTPIIKDDCDFNSSRDSYTIKKVRCTTGKGRGIPQSLRAFARIFSCTSSEELSDLAAEAAQNDGRLARRPLKSIGREIQAHRILLSWITNLMNQRHASIQSLEHGDSVSMSETQVHRTQMARDLLAGELGVLQTATGWLRNYCHGNWSVGNSQNIGREANDSAFYAVR